jgi:hypothetical protein
LKTLLSSDAAVFGLPVDLRPPLVLIILDESAAVKPVSLFSGRETIPPRTRKPPPTRTVDDGFGFNAFSTSATRRDVG